jgi:glycosyltransferase involved in cell wall biosynthesis
MRILQVCHKYPPFIGGVEEHVANVSRRLARHHSVTVFSCDPSHRLPRLEEVDGVSIRRFRSFSPGDSCHISPAMLRELMRSDFDILHAHNYHAFPLHFCMFSRQSPLTATPHYHGRGHTIWTDALLRVCRPVGRRVLAGAGGIIAVSGYERGLLCRDFGMEQSRVRLIPNGIDRHEFASIESAKRESRTILSVGRLEKYKGMEHLIKVLPLLDNGFRLKVVGIGSCGDNLAALAKRLGLERRVEFHGNLPRRKLLQMYSEAGLFALLSRHEASSMVVAEALASGAPCIVANTSALSEWIDNKHCFGIDYPLEYERLAELITGVAGVEIGEVDLPDWDDVVEQLHQVYLEALEAQETGHAPLL